ncbi:hypothetical protein [Actinoplanes couchii]|uniref:Uncharacterized protein n=1 Tax=Actinoplanes couchii TaxID=403638 RepID=A0ABQ3XJV0_9ACTN|nr:hypothetical protein [Actinoplanes couchii]MDR6324264.1 ABC-type Co2+ transport system permease subunit [Actinoplanes couchii]GID58773.1 hypothetical protein Aco03nite_071770 [Actinoplanes couchii]
MRKLPVGMVVLLGGGAVALVLGLWFFVELIGLSLGFRTYVAGGGGPTGYRARH